MEIIMDYNKELLDDLKIDQINILDKQLMLPALKHKWVARLIQAKQKRNELERRKKSLKEDILKKFEDEGIPKGIPKVSINQKIETTKTITDLSLNLEEYDLLIDFLEKIEKIFSSMTYDLGNASKLLSLELS
jgi:hypothetical protein